MKLPINTNMKDILYYILLIVFGLFIVSYLLKQFKITKEGMSDNNNGKQMQIASVLNF